MLNYKSKLHDCRRGDSLNIIRLILITLPHYFQLETFFLGDIVFILFHNLGKQINL